MELIYPEVFLNKFSLLKYSIVLFMKFCQEQEKTLWSSLNFFALTDIQISQFVSGSEQIRIRPIHGSSSFERDSNNRNDVWTLDTIGCCIVICH